MTEILEEKVDRALLNDMAGKSVGGRVFWHMWGEALDAMKPRGEYTVRNKDVLDFYQWAMTLDNPEVAGARRGRGYMTMAWVEVYLHQKKLIDNTPYVDRLKLEGRLNKPVVKNSIPLELLK